MKLTQLGSLYKLIRGESRNMRKSVAKQPRQRASAFVLESLENRVLLSATPMDVTTTEPVVTAAVVTTDKADYAPGETALITTSNTSAEGLKFGDGELVQFRVTRTDGIEDAPMGNLPWYVTDGVGGFAAYQDTIVDSNNDGVAESGDRNADGLADWIRPDNDLSVNGSISTSWLVEDQYLGASLQLKATGQDFGAVATTEFTDSGSFSSTTTSGFADTVSLAAGSTNSTALSVDVNAPKSNGNFDVSLSFATTGSTSIGIGTGANQINLTSVTRSFTTTDTLGDTDTFGITVSVGTGVAAGTYHFKATAIDSPDNISDGSKWAFDVIVTASTATTTTISSSLNSSTYGDVVTFTATVARTTGTGAPTGSVTFNIAGIGTGLVGTAGSTTPTTATWTYTTTATALTAGNHSVQAFYVHSGSFIDSTSGNITQTVNKADATFTVTPYTSATTTYDGNSHTATVTSITGVNGETGATVGTVNVSNTAHTDAGTYSSDSWSFTGTANYNNIAATTITDSIAKATAVVVVTPYTSATTTYDGNSHTATVTSITGVNGETGATVGTVNVSNTAHTDAGTYSSDSWSFTGTANYNNIAATTITDSIAKATAVVVVTPYTSATTTYDGNSHTATVTSITGVNGETGATVGTVNVSNTAHTDAGTYSSDSWSFTGTANYNNIAATTITDSIAKATAVVVVTPYTSATTTYDGNSHTATVTSITGVNGETGATVGTVNVSNTAHTDAGTYSSDSWSFTGTANYNNISATTITDSIAKATAVVVVTPYTSATTTYDGNSHTATVTSITGVNGETGATVGTVNVSNTAHTDAGTYSSDSWSFTGTANYNNIAATTITDSIAKATAVVVVTPYTSATTTYDGNSHTATVTSITGVNGETGATVGTVNVSNTAHTDAGTYSSDSWSFTGTANYNNIAATTITDSIAKATAVVVVTPYTSATTTYDGNSHTATVTSITGVNGETGATVGTVNVSNTAHTDAGTYSSDSWSFTGTANYNNIAATTITDSIAKATAVVVVTPYTSATTTYDGNSHTATVTSITGVNGETGATVGTVNVSNTAHTDAGTYSSDSWSFTGTANYNNIAATTITDSIAKASSTTTTVGAGPFIYDGSTHSGGSGTVTGAGGLNVSATSLTYVGNQIDAGTYTVTAHYAGDANHFGSDGGAVTITIGKATLTGLATTQSALNIAKQGALVFSLNSVTGMVNGDTLVSLLSSMSFTLKIGVNTYEFAPSVAIDTHGDGDASNDTVVVTYSMKNGGDAGLLAADLQALNISDGTASTSASNAQVDAIIVNMSTANYTFSDDALTKLFYSLK